ncbi:hypothetical protein D5086_028697 [Populus alba]|uniref:Uncharacterized protein n=1 Tax=Populus alba TaxID=43335 RepID=A0ACC4ASB3_POPAL
MSKPIGSEWSVMLISRLFLLNFLLLWQLGTGTPTFDDRIDEVESNGSLPDDEVSALQLLSKNLLSKDTTQLTLTHPICSTEPSSEIKCSCHSKKNQSVCSVIGIFLQSKNLDGSIDPSIGHFANLVVLDLLNNQLSGGIPSTLGNLQHLKYLDLSSNSLTGSIPPNLTKLHSLEYLDLYSNKLSGIIPKELGKLSLLSSLSLSFNKLSSQIPKELGNLSYLVSMYLGFNELTGQLPPELGRLRFLGNLDLSFNNLTGGIPDSMKNLTLTKMFLTGNMLNGTVPSWVPDTIEDKADLSYNNFEIPRDGPKKGEGKLNM